VSALNVFLKRSLLCIWPCITVRTRSSLRIDVLFLRIDVLILNVLLEIEFYSEWSCLAPLIETDK